MNRDGAVAAEAPRVSDIRTAAERLLRRADADGRLPTPVDADDAGSLRAR